MSSNKKSKSLVDSFVFQSAKKAVDRVTEEKNQLEKSSFTDREFKILSINQINTDPNQPRHFFDKQALSELSESIKKSGILQPILVRIDESETIWIVAGERRYKAARMAGLQEIPCIIITDDPDEIALIENIQRENLKPVEEAEAYSRLIKKHNYTQEQLAKVVGKGRTTITETISLNKLPDKIKKECLRVDIPKRALIEIARIKTEPEKFELFNRLKSQEITYRKKDQIKNPRKRKIRSKSVIAINRAKNLHNFLSKLDLKNVEEEDKVVLFDELYRLQKKLDDILN